MLAVVVYHSDLNGVRSLQTVREFLSDPRKLEEALQLMCASVAWGGLLAIFFCGRLELIPNVSSHKMGEVPIRWKPSLPRLKP